MDSPFPGEQLKVLATLGDLSILQDVDDVCTLDRTETMSDCDRTPSLGRLVESELDDLFGFRVERRCCLVEEQDCSSSSVRLSTIEERGRTLRIANECTSDGDTLLLTSRELSSLASNLGVIAVGKGQDEFVNAVTTIVSDDGGGRREEDSLGVLARLLNVRLTDLIRRDGRTEGDVELDATSVQRRLLRDE